MTPNDDFRSLHHQLPPNIRRRVAAGDLEGAVRLIDRCLADGLQPQLAPRLRCERERLLRLPSNYSIPLEEGLALLREEWPDVTEEQVRTLMDAGRIDWRYIDGKPHLHSRFLPSLRLYPKDTPGLTAAAPEGVSKEGALLERMARGGHLSASVTLRASIRPAEGVEGKELQAWLPIPAACPQQSHIELLELTRGGVAAPEDAPQRTLWWKSDSLREFSVTYRYHIRADYADLSRLKADPVQPAFCLEEEPPHLWFSPYLRELAEHITRGLTDPLDRARAIYDYVTNTVDYRFQPDYFQLPPIADLCARELRGDCGLFALLFIALCRLSGIPAQWQSGLAVNEREAGCHDWAMFYIAPHGWLWADCSYGSSARRKGDEARRRHYFGNLDPWRMVANRRCLAPLTPPSPGWRHDPYDNQLGEMTVDGRGLLGREMERSVDVVEFRLL